MIARVAEIHKTYYVLLMLSSTLGGLQLSLSDYTLSSLVDLHCLYTTNQPLCTVNTEERLIL